MAIELVFFDLGGVVVEVESDRLVHQVSQLLGRSFEDVQEVVYHQELLLPFELGHISGPVYYEGLKQRLSLPWTYEQFASAWNGIFSENREVLRIMERLTAQHTLMALTNTNALHLQHIKTTIPALSSFFHDWVASCDVGFRKPDPEIYRLALKRGGVRPESVVYIDDRPELVEAGRRVGLHAIRFENSEQLTTELRSFGITL